MHESVRLSHEAGATEAGAGLAGLGLAVVAPDLAGPTSAKNPPGQLAETTFGGAGMAPVTSIGVTGLSGSLGAGTAGTQTALPHAGGAMTAGITDPDEMDRVRLMGETRGRSTGAVDTAEVGRLTVMRGTGEAGETAGGGVRGEKAEMSGGAGSLGERTAGGMSGGWKGNGRGQQAGVRVGERMAGRTDMVVQVMARGGGRRIGGRGGAVWVTGGKE